jgi:formate hydrogenlyase transcriptional activator
VAEGPLRLKANGVGAALEGGVQHLESVEQSESADPVDSANELDGSEKNLRRAIDVVPALAWFARPDGSMEFLNKRWHDYTGLSPAETVGWGFQAAFHPEDREKGIERCRSLATENGPAECEIRLRRHDGVYRTFHIRIEPLRDETGRIIRWYGTSTDIEALKQTEERLREDERELRRITDAIPQAIVVQDPSGTPLYANRATLDYTGLAMEDVSKPGFRERVFHPEDIQRLAEYRKSALASGIPFQIEQRALGKDGHYGSVATTIE